MLPLLINIGRPLGGCASIVTVLLIGGFCPVITASHGLLDTRRAGFAVSATILLGALAGELGIAWRAVNASTLVTAGATRPVCGVGAVGHTRLCFNESAMPLYCQPHICV